MANSHDKRKLDRLVENVVAKTATGKDIENLKGHLGTDDEAL